MTRPIDRNTLQQAADRRRRESEPREVGEIRPGAARDTWPVLITADLDDGTYVGDMQIAPFLLFRETPDEEDPRQRPAIQEASLQTGVVDADTPTYLADAKIAVNPSTGESYWYFTYVEGLPPGGEEGMILTRDSDQSAYWDFLHVAY